VWSAVERDRRKQLVYQIQRRMDDKVMDVPLVDPAFTCASRPRLEGSGRGMIPQFAYSRVIHSGLYEDRQLKTP
jgi:hypothetical protein